MITKKKTLIMACLLFLTCSTTWAREIFIGIGTGQSTVDMGIANFNDGSLLSASNQNTSTVTKVFVNVQAGDFFGGTDLDFLHGEVGIMGISRNDFNAVSDGSSYLWNSGAVKAETRILSTYATLMHKPTLTENLSLTLKAGLNSWSAKTTYYNTKSLLELFVDSGYDLFYGLGLEYKLTKFGARLEYEGGEVDSVNVGTISLSLIYVLD